MAKQNNWLSEQLQAASTEVGSWSTSKQNAMKNAVKSKDQQSGVNPAKVTSKNEEK